ncbi:hypothetical protein ABPG72_019720 [Tetrahymena utriculariae]
MKTDLMIQQFEKQKKKSEICEKYFQAIRERLIYSSELTKYEIKHREMIIIEKSFFQEWTIDEIGTLSGRCVGEFSEIKKDLEEEGKQGSEEAQEILEEFIKTLKCKTISSNKTKNEMEDIIETFDQEGEFEITEAFSEQERHMYFEIKELLQKEIYSTILQYHENLQAEFLILLEKQIISNDTDVEQVFQIYLKPILKYKVHKRNSLEMETLISYLFSIIPQENFVIESDQIIDPREHIPFLTQIFEENNINEIQLLRTKDIKLFWDDTQKQFNVSVDYNIKQKQPLPIQKGEIAHNVKASFEEYLFDLNNNQNKNINCFQNLLQSGLKVELQQGEVFDPEKIQLQINPIIKETANYLNLSKISEQSIRVLKKNTQNQVLAILFINHKKKLSLKALKDIFEIKKKHQNLNVCVLDVEESDLDFINQIKTQQYDKEMEFYYCDYSVQIQLVSIFPQEYYPAIMIIDGHNQIIAKEQFYCKNWQSNIKNDNDIIKQAKGLSLIQKNNEGNQSVYDQIYKQIKEKFLKDPKKKVTLFNCGMNLKQLGYPVSLELCISNQHILDWEGTFKQKIYNQPYIQHNISQQHIQYIQPFLDLIFTHAPQDKFIKRVCDYELKRGSACKICNHAFTPEKEENQYFSFNKNEHYCEKCFNNESNRRFFFKNIVFIHFQAVMQSFNSDQFGQNTQPELIDPPLNDQKSINQFEQSQEDTHEKVECIGCDQIIQGRRWICLSCDRSRESKYLKNQINLCEFCQNLMKQKRKEERISEKMFKHSDKLLKIESQYHECHHITLGVSFFYGKNVF